MESGRVVSPGKLAFQLHLIAPVSHVCCSLLLVGALVLIPVKLVVLDVLRDGIADVVVVSLPLVQELVLGASAGSARDLLHHCLGGDL